MMDAFRNELGYGTDTSVAGTSAGIGNALADPATNATKTGLYGLANFTPQGGTDYNINAAGRYADNPYISGQVAAAMRDANQNYTDITSPGIDRNSAGGGNINSSTNGIAHGIVERGLTQKAGDISATLRGNAWNSGLTTAQNTANSQNSSILSALMAAASGGTSAAGTAVGANTGSVGQAGGLFNIANTGASNLNAGDQANLTNQLQAWNFGVNSPFAALNNYYNIVGNKAWGSQGSGTSTSTSTPSTMDMIGSGMGILGSFMKSDARVKFDAKPIGKLDDGQTVYRFRYRDTPNAVHIGLMAQEVEQRYPYAVAEFDGVKHVNYDLATRNA